VEQGLFLTWARVVHDCFFFVVTVVWLFLTGFGFVVRDWGFVVPDWVWVFVRDWRLTHYSSKYFDSY
jgi:hypothetical protein